MALLSALESEEVAEILRETGMDDGNGRDTMIYGYF